ncbi:hypothetical protein AUJ46_05865 [Candidatus Peregrinibacteria bacterium CG1_02_54_53]|nr:MAG: hypothetical protein AUJ46_05865 [Candidatus Peregrinibacteria bacterium CG1_02_54_53]
MTTKKVFTTEQARSVGEQIGLVWGKEPFDVGQFRMGMDVELEHGAVDSQTDVTNDDPVLTGKIALAHLREMADYYTRLYEMEEEGEAYWEAQKK